MNWGNRVGEHVAGQPDAALEVLESPGAVERLAQNHPDPAFTHDGRRTGDRAVLINQIRMLHASEDNAASSCISKLEIRTR